MLISAICHSFAAAATDIETGERIILTEGPVARIVRASCSVPGIIAPIEHNGRLLCDGGISDNLPDFAARMLGADYVIGVDVFAPEFRTFLGPAGALLAAVKRFVQHAGGGDLDADCLIVPIWWVKVISGFQDIKNLLPPGEQATMNKLPEIRAALEPNGQPHAHNSRPQTHYRPAADPKPLQAPGLAES